jgi:hypothetical protein
MLTLAIFLKALYRLKIGEHTSYYEETTDIKQSAFAVLILGFCDVTYNPRLTAKYVSLLHRSSEVEWCIL